MKPYSILALHPPTCQLFCDLHCQISLKLTRYSHHHLDQWIQQRNDHLKTELKRFLMNWMESLCCQWLLAWSDFLVKFRWILLTYLNWKENMNFIHFFQKIIRMREEEHNLLVFRIWYGWCACSMIIIYDIRLSIIICWWPIVVFTTFELHIEVLWLVTGRSRSFLGFLIHCCIY